MFRNFATYLALTSILGAAFACGSDDDGGGGQVATGGTTSGGSGGTTTGGGGVAQGGTGGLVTGGTAGSSAGGSAGAVNWGPYPQGPYGHEVGDTIADLAWEGYVNDTGQQSSDTLPYGDYGTDAMRKSGKPYGLIHISAFT